MLAEKTLKIDVSRVKTLEFGVQISARQTKVWTSKSKNFETKPNKIAVSYLVFLPIFRSIWFIFIEIFTKNFVLYFLITLYMLNE